MENNNRSIGELTQKEIQITKVPSFQLYYLAKIIF